MYTIRRWWDRYALQLVLGIFAVGAGLTIRQTQGTAIFELYQSITSPFQVGSTQVEKLSNARIIELQTRLAELEAQNKKLKELLDYSTPKQSVALLSGSETHLPIVASVVGRSADHWWQHITIGRGTDAGIQVGFVVTAPGGLVGRVISVTPNTSRVLLISDPMSQVGITLSRSRHMGFMRGQFDNTAVVQFFDKVPDVRRGDVVTTSTYSQLFPAGLPVGRVVSVNLKKNPAPEAVITLSAPIPSLEWVVVNPKAHKIEG